MNKTRDNGVNFHLARNNKQWVWEHILGGPFELCNDATYSLLLHIQVEEKGHILFKHPCLHIVLKLV